MRSLRVDDPLAVVVTDAIRGGEVNTLQRLLDEHPELACVLTIESSLTPASLCVWK